MPPLVYFSLAFLLGIALTGLAKVSWPPELLIPAAFVSLSALLLWRDRRGLLLCLCGGFFLLGALRYESAAASPHDALTRYHDSGPVTLQGVVAQPPDVRDSGTDLRIAVSQIRQGNAPCEPQCEWTPIAGTLLARLPRYTPYVYGDAVEMAGTLRSPPSLPGFSYRDYLASQDIFSLLDRPRSKLIAGGQGNALFGLLFEMRDGVHEIINRSLPEPGASLLSGILLGLYRGIPAETVEAFQRTSTSHILAISGYNIVILAGFVSALSALVLRKRRTWIVVVLVISVYVVFVGASASVVRAGIMGLLAVLGPAFGRPAYALNSLALAAFGMAILWPFMLWDAGFQLSFAATLAILLLVQPFGEAFERWLIRSIESVRVRETILLVSGDMLTSIAATLITLPIIAYDFHNLSLIGLGVNLLVLPAQPAVMATGLLVIFAGWIHPLVGQLMGWLAWPFLAWTANVVEWAATLPFASLNIDMPLWAVVLYYGLLGGLVWWRWRTTNDGRQSPSMRGGTATEGGNAQHFGIGPLHFALAAGAFAVCLIWAAASAQPDGLLHVSFLDVGQGNATLIRTPSGQMVVIDGGPGATALVDALGRSMPFYQHDVSLGVLTRAADENLTGLVSMLEHYHANTIIAPANVPRSTASERWRALIAEQSIPVIVAADDLHIDLGDGAQLVVLQAGDETTAMTLRLSYGKFSVYFDGGTGLLPPAPTTVLRATGHGNANTVAPQLLDALTPSFVVFSLGGTPPTILSADLLTRVGDAGATMYRTDANGTITLTSDGARLWVETER